VLNISKIIARENSGFTMLEVMVAISITAVIMSFIGMSLVTAARMNTLSESQNTAINLAEEKVEQLRRFSFTNISSGADTVGEFIREWTVIDNMGKPRIKNVEMKVSWLDSKDNIHDVAINTIFYRNAYPYR